VEAGGFKNQSPGPSFVFSSAKDVARAGLEGADKGKRVVIPGLGNRVQATLGQHSPRAIMLGPVASVYRRVIGE
jgi:short-subunit dehydrogenase